MTGATTASVSGGIQLQYTAAASTVTSGVVSGSGTGLTTADGTFQQQLLLQSPAFCKFDQTIFSVICEIVNEVVEPSFRTLRKCAEACQTDLLNFDWNQRIKVAGISGFT